MKIFEQKDEKIIVNTEVLIVPEFKAIYDRDKTKGKHQAFKEFAYIYHISDINSVYSAYSEDIKILNVKTEIMKDPKFKPDSAILKAIDKYKSFTETPIQRLFLSCKKKIDELADFMNTSKVDDDSLKLTLEVFTKITPIIANFSKLEDSVMKENSTASSKIRGNKEVSQFED
jgi:hypothetical protein